jgi:hopanoid biosynthesis associated protein HpnK
LSDTAEKRLIVSADDFGMSAGVNAAVIEAHERGILTNTSLMVTGAAFDEAVNLARSHPRLGVGLHLVLVQGHAAAQSNRIPQLVHGDARLRDNPVWNGFRYFFQPQIRPELCVEITAQVERFLGTGLVLSHVDGHLNVHVHPTVLRILIDLAPRYGIRAMRVPRDPVLAALRFDQRHLGRKLFEGAVFSLLSRYAARRLARAGIRHPDRLYGLHQTGHISEDYLLSILQDLPAGTTEIYCHPGYADDESRRWRPAEYEPERELAALTSPRVREAIHRRGVRLASYKDLAS